MLNFYDFEVFKYDWLVVIINPVEKTETIIINDKAKLEEYYEAHKNEMWIGYNNRRYDQYIMKAILCEFNPKDVSDFIIVDEKHGWQYSTLFQKFKMINFDTALKTDKGLKVLEGMMGNDIRETTVPFNIDRKLTAAEIAETVKYCKHDVEQTIEVFIARKSEFDASMGLIKIFGLPISYMGKTKAQLVSAICGGIGKKFDDEFEFKIVDALRLSKYKHIANWYRDKSNHNYTKSFNAIVAGVEHIFAWGGIHGAIPQYYGEGVFLMADVTAYYPSLQLQYKFGYRNMSNPENFEHIHNENLRLKVIDKKARLPYKIADNSMSGQLKDRNSKLYDPRDNNAITVNGQLLLVDLIEKLEPHIDALIQSNTDGILIKLKSIDDYDKIDDIVWEWEQRTGMRMGFDLYTKVFQKDVNNYLIVAEDGSYKSKGGYVKQLSQLDYDLPIINEALVAYMTKHIPVETTINNCDELIKFQKVVKVSKKYMYGLKNPTYRKQKIQCGISAKTGRPLHKTVELWNGDGEKLTDTTFRVFASNDPNDGMLAKVKTLDKNPEKFADTPERCFIDNGDVKEKRVPKKLDKQWYIDLAIKRLRQFGVM